MQNSGKYKVNPLWMANDELTDLMNQAAHGIINPKLAELRERASSSTATGSSGYLTTLFALADEPPTLDAALGVHSRQSQRGSGLTSERNASPSLVHALKSLIERSDPSSILHIGCGWGDLLLQLMESTGGAHVTAVDESDELLDFGRLIDRDNRIEWISADLLDVEQIPTGKFDFVLVTPELGRQEDKYHRMEILNPVTGELASVSDRKSFITSIAAASQISSEGLACIVVPSVFTSSDRKLSAFEILPKLGLSVSGLFHIPSHRTSASSGFDWDLLVLTRAKSKISFVGMLTTSNMDFNEKVLNRYFSTDSTGSIQTGRQVSVNKPYDFRSEFALERVKERAKRTGLKAVPLREIATDVSKVRRSEISSIELSGQEVFVPEFLGSKAVKDLDTDLPYNPST
jgi:hypothetical protein